MYFSNDWRVRVCIFFSFFFTFSNLQVCVGNPTNPTFDNLFKLSFFCPLAPSRDLYVTLHLIILTALQITTLL